MTTMRDDEQICKSDVSVMDLWVEMDRKRLFSQRLEGGPWDRGWDYVGVSTDPAVHWTDLGA